MSSRSYDARAAQHGRLWTPTGLVLILVIIVGTYFLGRQFNSHDLAQRDLAIQQLQSDGQRLSADIADQNANLSALRGELNSTKAKLEAILPSQNTYNINPNQSLIVADGRLVIGLIGSPKNEGVDLNINNKAQTLASGDVVRVSPDASTTCQVQVQSFDAFKAVIFASCAAAKSQ
jgi:hypothetical protein